MRGFTLVETIVAALILAGVVAVVSAISSNAMVWSRLNREYAIAASIADRQLSMIQYAGVDELVKSGGRMEGRVDDIPPGFAWSAASTYEGIDALYTVTLIVSWASGGRIYRLQVQTQMNGTSTIVPSAAAQGT